uniref:Si:ch73-233k15.2 n=1 Tax=Stegastes partitus TaxID=144197 RepID=A0A3B5AV75_9TELE
MFSEWIDARKTELRKIMSIKDKRPSAFVKSMRDLLIWSSADIELEKELDEVLKDTLGGLEKLHCFLDAVEKLAVTSLHVFMENQVFHLPKEISCEYVQVVIGAARLICHVLLEFKRDAHVFFRPKIRMWKCWHIKRQPRMLQFLKELEEIAVQLDKMNKGAKISSVAGSSVGAVGGVLSIVGLALIPFTAGGSLALTIGGLGLGITSGVNSIVTTAAEAGVNATQKKKAGDVIQSFMKDMQIVQAKLIEIFVAFIKIGVKTYSVKRQIGLLTEAVSAAKALRNEELISSVGAEAVQEVNIARAAESVASELPEVTEAAVEGPLSLSRTVRMGSAALNALFIGVDVYFICKDSISLAKETWLTKSIVDEVISIVGNNVY